MALGQRDRERAAPRVDWLTWFTWFRREWRPGEHVSIIGPTGTGKTTLEIEIARARRYVVFLATKVDDEKIRGLEQRGYSFVPAWPKRVPEDVDRLLLWPSGRGFESKHRQRIIVHDALSRIFAGPRGGAPGRWCIVIDEARYVSDPKYLGLAADVNQMLIQGRSIDLSVVCGFQRPSWVPQEAYDQPSRLFIANDNDHRNARRFREIGGADGERLAYVVQRLGRYEWAHVDSRPGQGEIRIIQVPKELARK